MSSPPIEIGPGAHRVGVVVVIHEDAPEGRILHFFGETPELDVAVTPADIVSAQTFIIVPCAFVIGRWTVAVPGNVANHQFVDGALGDAAGGDGPDGGLA